MTDEPILAESALKHGVDKRDIVHAYRDPIRIWDLGDGFTMMVGAKAAGIFPEVGYIQGVVTVPWSSSTRCAPERSSSGDRDATNC